MVLILLSWLALIVAFAQFFAGIAGVYFMFIFSFSLIYALWSGWVAMYWSLSNQPSKGVKLGSFWLTGCIIGCVLFLVSLIFSIFYYEDFGADAKIITANLFGFPFILSLLHIYVDYRIQVAANDL